MTLDDQEFKKFATSRARLAYCCGILHGALETIRPSLPPSSPFSDSLSNSLSEVTQILEAEFYPQWAMPPKGPKGPAIPPSPSTPP